MRYKTLIYELGLALYILLASVIVSRDHSEYNLNNKAVCKCFENNSSEKFIKVQACTEKLHWKRASPQTFFEDFL